VIFATICFRWFNLISTGELLWNYSVEIDGCCNLLKEKWDTALAIAVLERAQREGKQIFTGAFNISNSGSTKPKINRVCEDYIQPVWADRIRINGLLLEHGMTLSTAFRFLSKYPGLGGSGFMAAQVIADLKYTDILHEAADWETWCVLGPGSKRGLNRVTGQHVDAPLPKGWQTTLEILREAINSHPGTGAPKYHAQDTQNCLCEWDKYERVLWNQGQSKRKYKGL
jgi:hypothetical protein